MQIFLDQNQPDNEGPVRFRPRKTPLPNRREQSQGLTAGRRFVSDRIQAEERKSRLVTAQVLRLLYSPEARIKRSCSPSRDWSGFPPLPRTLRSNAVSPAQGAPG